MEAKQCILCRKAITPEIRSAEHIIPNAIGGRKRVVGFICRPCNNDAGSKWDAELAHQMNFLGLLLGITRQRGVVRSQTFPTYSGDSIRVNVDGTMTLGEPKEQGNTEGTTTRLHIEAGTRREFRQFLGRLRGKYPQLRRLDLDVLASTAQDGTYYSSDPFEITGDFGRTRSGRSLVKSAVALVYDAGVDPRQCDLALNYLLNEDEEPCFGYFYDSDKDLVINRPPNSPFHCVYVKGCSANSTLVGYVEYYSIWRMVLCLSESYTGNDFTHTYAVDPIDGKQMDISVNSDLSISDIHEAYEYKRYDIAVLGDAISKVFDTVQEIGFKRAMDRAIKNAIEVACSRSGLREGDMLTDEQISDVSGDIAEGMMPFIIHHMRLNDHLVDVIRQDKK